MARKLELSITSGRIYAGMSKIAKAKRDFTDKVQEIYSNQKLSDEGKKEEEALYRNRYEETCKKANEDMEEAIVELQNAVNTSQFTPSQEMRDTIDFIETMQKGGCLSDRVLDEQLSKFKNCIGTAPFDNLTFSGYSKGDIDKPAQFISPDAYFNQLRESLEKEDNTMTAYLMNGVEERLGIKSAERKRYETERQASVVSASQLI